ncbi:MAG TPA: hypothetical protein VLT82_20165 [Myxococcaceae bacterium]|nr:hypothetical protein [Myxococcaceae bacterium]
MRPVLAIVLLCLAPVGLGAPLWPMEACASVDLLQVQTVVDDEALDDSPWVVREPSPVVLEHRTLAPPARSERHTPLLQDQRRYRPPRA